MACLEMYNKNSSEHHKGVNNGAPIPPIMSPRISFSNDFIDSSSSSHSHSHSHSHLIPHSQMRGAGAYRDAPVSSDFEFSVSNYSMMSADELFSKGRLLPYKENCKKTTLRDELQHEDVVESSSEDFSLRPPKNPTRWRGFLGLRKSHIGSKRSDKGEASRQSFHLDDAQSNKNSKDSVE